MPNVYFSKIVENTQIANNIYSLKFSCKEIAEKALAGQFVHISCGHSRILRRPISICDITGDEIRIVFETKGEGTKWLSARRAGESIDVLGPLGNGFTIPDGDVIVIGGGIGVPPMLYTVKAATAKSCNVTAILGFRSSEQIILQNEFEKICKQVIITTDDGSAGKKGFVTETLEELLIKHVSVLSCGPHIMQKAIAEICKRHETPCQVSLEERMGCGVGACLVCVCATKRDGMQSMSRVCVDGPVFNGNELEIPNS